MRDVLGIDISEVTIAAANRHVQRNDVRRVRFAIADVEVGQDFGEFDVITDSQTICYTDLTKSLPVIANALEADGVLAAVPHRHYVLALLKMLRAYFQRYRPLLKHLCTAAHQSLTLYLRSALGKSKAHPSDKKSLLATFPQLARAVSSRGALKDPRFAPVACTSQGCVSRMDKPDGSGQAPDQPKLHNLRKQVPQRISAISESDVAQVDELMFLA